MSEMQDLSHISLDLDTYSLQDLIRLFRLTDLSSITNDDMKSARKIVMMTHPDKSGLNKEYFQFFAKAYERINSVVDFTNRTAQSASGYYEKHRKIDVEIDRTNGGNLGEALKKAKIISNDYTVGERWNKWKREFDKWFEENGELSSNSNGNEGYEEFMKSTVDLLPEGASEAEARAFMESRKSALGALVSRESITGIDSWNSFSSGGGYSQMGNDLRHVYTETVVPVTDEDFKNTPKYSSLDEYKRVRHGLEYVDDNTYEQFKEEYRRDKNNKEEQELAEYYDHLKQFEMNKEKVSKFQSNILRLK